jgi:hypothetical protein
MRKVEKYCRAGQATDDIMAHAHCMLDTQDHKHLTYVVLIAFLLQQWLYVGASLLCYSYIACIVFSVPSCHCNDHEQFVLLDVTCYVYFTDQPRGLVVRVSDCYNELCFSRQPGYHPSRTAPQLQHTAIQEQYSQCGSSTTYSQNPEDGLINARNMLSL